MARKYLEPNRLDPLSENALNRRVWAAYLHAGYDRTGFADAMGVRYNLVSYWDTGRHVMSLAYFMRAAELVGFSMDELAHGHAARRSGQAEGALSQDAIRSLLHAVRATAEQIEALAEHQESTAGRLQPMTRTYVLRYIATYSSTLAMGKTAKQAAKIAFAEAVNARAAVSAHDSGRTPLGASNGHGTTANGAARKRSAASPPRKKSARVTVEKPTEN